MKLKSLVRKAAKSLGVTVTVQNTSDLENAIESIKVTSALQPREKESMIAGAKEGHAKAMLNLLALLKEENAFCLASEIMFQWKHRELKENEYSATAVAKPIISANVDMLEQKENCPHLNGEWINC